MYVCACVRVYVCTCVRVCVCTCVRVCVSTCTQYMHVPDLERLDIIIGGFVGHTINLDLYTSVHDGKLCTDFINVLGVGEGGVDESVYGVMRGWVYEVIQYGGVWGDERVCTTYHQAHSPEFG